MKQKIMIALAMVLALCITCRVVGTRSAAGGVTAYINRTTWVYARPATSAPKTVDEGKTKWFGQIGRASCRERV